MNVKNYWLTPREIVAASNIKGGLQERARNKAAGWTAQGKTHDPEPRNSNLLETVELSRVMMRLVR